MKHFQSEDLGFKTWIELYHFLEEHGVENEKKVVLRWPEADIDEDETTRPETDISVDYVKARAFEELYQRLPLRRSITVTQDLLIELQPNTDVLRVMQFLNKIPTRAK